MTIVGRPGQGKSHLIKYLCYDLMNKKAIDTIYLFGGSVFTGAYDYLPSNYTGKYSENNLNKIIGWQLKRIKSGKANNIMIIFDDVMNLTNEFKKNIFRKLISEFRHYKIIFIFSVQYLKGVNPVFRECTTHAVFFKTTNKMSLDAIHENFMNEMESSKEVGKYFNKELDEKHKFLFVDVNGEDKNKYNVGKCSAKLPDYKLKY
jgi:hypothetical protein